MALEFDFQFISPKDGLPKGCSISPLRCFSDLNVARGFVGADVAVPLAAPSATRGMEAAMVASLVSRT